VNFCGTGEILFPFGRQQPLHSFDGRLRQKGFGHIFNRWYPQRLNLLLHGRQVLKAMVSNTE
jgi:hypothetical protein